MYIRSGASLLIVAALTGCTARTPPLSAPVSVKVEPPHATAPSSWTGETKENLALEQIRPAPVLKTPSSQPAGLPAVEAVRLFAQARIAMLDGNRAAAIDDLQKAVALDPQSFELHKLLGDLYQLGGDRQALGEWEKAASQQPDHLDLQIKLGRIYAARSNFADAITHLRLAQQTSDYQHDDPASAEADFLLARALQESGYDRAALSIYERLLDRVENEPSLLRRNPQAAMLLAHPEPLALHIAQLYEKHHQYELALKVLRPAAGKNPDDFDVQAQIVRDTAVIGQTAQAQASALDLVLRFHASPPSLGLLREISGSDQSAIDKLSKLHQHNPDERSIVYALIDTQFAHGQPDQAQQLLDSASKRWPDDLRLLRRRVDNLRGRGLFTQAATMLIEALARRPENHLEITPMWEELSRPSAHGRLRLGQVDSLNVSRAAMGAKLLLMGKSARIDRGETAEREIIRKAVDARPIFAPAWREMLALIWSDDARPTQQKVAASNDLANSAEKSGDTALADELHGQAALNQDNAGTAALAFAKAIREDDRSPELYLNFATALHLSKDDRAAQAILMRLIEQHPLCSETYLALFEIYQSAEQSAPAARLLHLWLAADPDSVPAQRLHAKEAVEQRRLADADRLLQELLDEHPSDPQVLASLQELYKQTSRVDELIDLLSKRLADQPWNITLGEVLADSYQQQHKTASAIKVADGLRSHITDDPDLLYALSGLYSRLSADDQSEQVLVEVLKLDSAYPGANNDLGFLWADHGKNLGQAEDLIRKAVTAQPDNPSFLDSLGWVLYKRGKFAEAVAPLEKAASPAEQADPIVLDHLGDAEYRLGKNDQASKVWQQAAKRLAELHDDTREDYRDLQTRLVQKQQELNAGKAVTVAPVVEVK